MFWLDDRDVGRNDVWWRNDKNVWGKGVWNVDLLMLVRRWC